MAFTAAGQVDAQVTYTVEGFANNLDGDTSFLSDEVASNESYTATFEINNLATDFNPASDAGLYAGAITSSSIVFSGGYESAVDFSGGTVIVQQNNAGSGGILLNDASGLGAIALFAPVPFASDALLAGQQSFSSETDTTLWSLTEPDGLIVSGSFPAASAPITFSVNAAAVPEPTSLSLLGLGVVIASVRRRRK